MKVDQINRRLRIKAKQNLIILSKSSSKTLILQQNKLQVVFLIKRRNKNLRSKKFHNLRLPLMEKLIQALSKYLYRLKINLIVVKKIRFQCQKIKRMCIHHQKHQFRHLKLILTLKFRNSQKMPLNRLMAVILNKSILKRMRINQIILQASSKFNKK